MMLNADPFLRGRKIKTPIILEDIGVYSALDYQDSNLDKQNQNLLCYHYTIVQTLGFLLKSGAKIGLF